MKRPIAWHFECLNNHRQSVQQQREEVARAIASLERSEARLAADEAQYAEAVRRGVTEYDSEKFGKKRKAQEDKAND